MDYVQTGNMMPPNLLKVSTVCLKRVLRKKKSIGVILLFAIIPIYYLFWAETTTQTMYWQVVKYRPKEYIVRNGEKAKDVSNVSRYIALNDFSQLKYLEISKNTTEKVTSNKSVITTSSRPMEKGDCKPIECNKGTCFENMLCYSLPKFLPNFKNPCFYEKVSMNITIRIILRTS